MTTSMTEAAPSPDELAAGFQSLAEHFQRQLDPVAEALAHVAEQVEQSMAAISAFLVEAVGPQLRRCGLMPPLSYRTTKAERRAAKRYLAVQRRCTATATRLGIAATARWLADEGSAGV